MHLRFVCVRVCAILRPTDTDSYFAIVIVYLPIGTLIIAKKALANDGPEQLSCSASVDLLFRHCETMRAFRSGRDAMRVRSRTQGWEMGV